MRKQILYRFVLPLLIFPIYFLLRSTWRIREHGDPIILEKYIKNREKVIFAHWHGDELALLGYYAFRGLAVLSSLSDDGTLMASCLTLFGFRVYRGSSTRGGARGLIGLIKAVRSGSQGAVAVDGPKGPIYEVKPGIIELAAKTGVPILPIHTKASSAWFIPRAWNKSYLPKPFARIDVYYGKLIPVSDDAKDVGYLCSQVKQDLDLLIKKT